MPGLSLYVAVLPSALSPPLSLLGTSAARTGVNLPSPLTVMSGSQQKRPAMESLVPCDRCGLRMVGPCHIRMRSAPPLPRAPAGAAAAAGLLVAPAAGAVVGAAGAGAPAVGALIDGAADEQAPSKEANTPPVRPTAARASNVRLVNPTGVAAMVF